MSAIVWYKVAVGAVLFCGITLTPDTQPWVAWPFKERGGQCGDIIRIETLDGQVYDWPALDSGEFGHHCVMQLDGSCPPIAVDVPEAQAWFKPDLSTLGRVWNLSERARLYNEYPQQRGAPQ